MNYMAINNHTADTYIQFLDKLITRFQFKGYDSFKFFFSRGEPVYWKPLLEVAEFIHEKCDKPLLKYIKDKSQIIFQGINQ